MHAVHAEHTFPLPAFMLQVKNVAGELIFNYLRHNGHWETAAAVGRDVLGGAVEVSSHEVTDMQMQQVRTVWCGVCGAVARVK
jgi:hypothetical protein